MQQKKWSFTFPNIENIDTNVCKNTTVEGKQTKFKLGIWDKIVIVSLISWEPWPHFLMRSCLRASYLVSQVFLLGENAYWQSLCQIFCLIHMDPFFSPPAPLICPFLLLHPISSLSISFRQQSCIKLEEIKDFLNK